MSKRKRQRDASTMLKAEQITNEITGETIQIWVGREDHRFEVSKSVVEQVRWFRKFVSREWSGEVYRLPEDNPELMRVVLNVLHHQLSRLPPTMTVSELFELATLCEKYDLTDFLVPHLEARNWIEQLWRADRPVDSDWWMWVWILEAFYHSEDACPKLARTLDVIAGNMIQIESEWVFESLNKECIVSHIEHRDSGNHTPSDHLQLRRQKLWKAFRNACEDLQHTWLNQQDPNLRNVGLVMKLLQADAPEQLPPDTTLVAQLEYIQQKLLWAPYRVFGEHAVKALLLEHLRRVKS